MSLLSQFHGLECSWYSSSSAALEEHLWNSSSPIFRCTALMILTPRPRISRGEDSWHERKGFCVFQCPVEAFLVSLCLLLGKETRSERQMKEIKTLHVGRRLSEYWIVFFFCNVSPKTHCLCSPLMNLYQVHLLPLFILNICMNLFDNFLKLNVTLTLNSPILHSWPILWLCQYFFSPSIFFQVLCFVWGSKLTTHKIFCTLWSAPNVNENKGLCD